MGLPYGTILETELRLPSTVTCKCLFFLNYSVCGILLKQHNQAKITSHFYLKEHRFPKLSMALSNSKEHHSKGASYITLLHTLVNGMDYLGKETACQLEYC